MTQNVNRGFRVWFASGPRVLCAPRGPPAKRNPHGIIGIGKRGTTLTGQVLAAGERAGRGDLRHRPERARRCPEPHQRDSPRSFTDYRQVLDLQNVDAVIVATPCYLHSEIAVACLNAGKYVYCEKPLGITPEQVHNASASGGAVPRSFSRSASNCVTSKPLRETIRKIHEDKIIGEPFVIKAQRHSTPYAARRRDGAARMVQRRQAFGRPDRRECGAQSGRLQLGGGQPSRQRIWPRQEVFPAAACRPAH